MNNPNPVQQAQNNQQANQGQAEGYLSNMLSQALAGVGGMPAAPSTKWGAIAPPPGAGGGGTMGGGMTTGKRNAPLAEALKG